MKKLRYAILILQVCLFVAQISLELYKGTRENRTKVQCICVPTPQHRQQRKKTSKPKARKRLKKKTRCKKTLYRVFILEREMN